MTTAQHPPAQVREPTLKATRVRIVAALREKNRAKSHELWADHKANRGDRIGAIAARHDAKVVSDRADEDLSRWAYTTENVKPRGNGGELMTLPEPEDMSRRAYKRQVVEEAAGVLEHQASSDAMDLANRADVLPAALEMANSIKAKNRAERMLAHQAATFHAMAMNFAARANNEIERANRHADSGNVQWRQIANVEAARVANASARAASAMNDALLTLQKLRTGGKQVVQVQHVTVQGGQAIVGQNVKPAGKARKSPQAIERKAMPLIEDKSGGRNRRGRGSKTT